MKTVSSRLWHGFLPALSKVTSCKKKSLRILVRMYFHNIPSHNAHVGYERVTVVAKTANMAAPDTKHPMQCEPNQAFSAKGPYGGEAGLPGGTWSWDPVPAPRVRGSIYTKTGPQALGQNTHTVATIYKEVLTPSRLPRKNRKLVRRGGDRGKNPKRHCGVFSAPKMINLKGVQRQNPYIAVGYPNSEGCCWACCDMYARRIRRDIFLQSLTLLRAGKNPCQELKMTVSTNNCS